MTEYESSPEIRLLDSWVQEQIEVWDMIATDYPQLTKIADETKHKLLTDPMGEYDKRAHAMRVARESFPALWNVMVES